MALRSSAGRPSFGYLSWACKKGDKEHKQKALRGTIGKSEEQAFLNSNERIGADRIIILSFLPDSLLPGLCLIIV
jgi:hypothetical protein